MFYAGLFANRSAWSHLLILLFTILVGFLFAIVVRTVVIYLFADPNVSLFDDPSMMRLLQFVSAVCAFLIPSLGVAWLCSYRLSDFLSLHRVKGGKVWLYTALGVVSLSPAISVLAWVNRQMELPAFLAPVEQWMRVQEKLAEQLTEVMFTGSGIEVMLMNLFVVAATAAVAEEFLFRGVIQRIFSCFFSNAHQAIWMTAFLFSAIHLQFYGFVPRLLLGAYLGYLLYWSRSIWVSVFAHFVNNAVVVVLMSLPRLRECKYVSGELASGDILNYLWVAVVAMLFFAWTQKQLHHHLMMQR